MPAYTFEALDANGSTRKGVIEADTAKAARGLLRAQLLVPMVLQPVSGQANNAAETGTSIASTTLWSSRVFNATALAIWTRQIAGLVASGLPAQFGGRVAGRSEWWHRLCHRIGPAPPRVLRNLLRGGWGR